MRWLALGLCFVALSAEGGQVLVAVATSFRGCAEELGELFLQETGQELAFSAGSTGKLFSQILFGAPFEVFLAADSERPRRLIQLGKAVAGSQRTYARGRLVLWAPGRRANENLLRQADFHHLALAQPEVAPYGLAAVQTLAALGLHERLKGRLVYGENVGQAYALVYSGNAEAGLVARALLGDLPDRTDYWLIPADHHSPILQDLVLLTRGADNPAARAFIEFLRSAAALAVIRSQGYEAPVHHG